LKIAGAEDDAPPGDKTLIEADESKGKLFSILEASGIDPSGNPF